ncbi:hypothetical protein Tco_1369964 [Tanacetum coccineum]
MSTDIVKLDLFDGESFKRWQKKPWLNPVNCLEIKETKSWFKQTLLMGSKFVGIAYAAKRKKRMLLGLVNETYPLYVADHCILEALRPPDNPEHDFSKERLGAKLAPKDKRELA